MSRRRACEVEGESPNIAHAEQSNRPRMFALRANMRAHFPRVIYNLTHIRPFTYLFYYIRPECLAERPRALCNHRK